ncbi:MAG: RNA polymerase sigma factor [Gemmatimonadota bacterium]
MPRSLPPQLTELLDSPDPASRETAWAAFLERYSPVLLHTARKLARDYDEAMDRYRFVLTELQRDEHRRLRAYAAYSGSTFSNWLIVVASRLCTDYHRARYGRVRGSEGRDLTAHEAREVRRRLADFDVEELDPSRVPSRGDASPDQRVRIAELSRALATALGALDTRDRLLLKLRFEDDRSVREIAGIMGFPSVFHVYRRLKALNAVLRRQLKKQGIDAPEP